jgi:hypothetical protein
MPSLFVIISVLLVVLVVLGVIGAARRRRARVDHGKESRSKAEDREAPKTRR